MKNFSFLFLLFAFFYVFGNKINDFISSIELGFVAILYIVINFIILCFIVRIIRNIYLWLHRKKKQENTNNIKEEIKEKPYNPYNVLGLCENASNDEIKSQWKKLVKENHPDNLSSKGLPSAYIDLANKLMSDINSAYDIIAKERKIK